MSLAVDMKYVQLLSGRLERFKQKNSMLWSFRCPLCGDSKRNKAKTRGHIYEKHTKLFFHCFNCEAGFTFANFIKALDPALYRQYHFEKFVGIKTEALSLPSEKPRILSGADVEIKLPAVANLPTSHLAKRYLMIRKIPEQFHSEIYYSADFLAFCDQIMPNHGKKVGEDPRLVVPFYDADKKLQGFFGRSLKPKTEIRYISLKLHENNIKLFGLNKLDRSKRVLVVEGAFDAMFLPNALASLDSNLTSVIQHCLDCQYTFIFDNEPRNTQIVHNMSKTINLGHDIVVWPKSISHKDINEMVVAGLDVEDWISKRTFSGARAKLELQNWKRT